jgi:hypothetical protein
MLAAFIFWRSKMSGEKQQELPADLSRAQKRFQQWRRTRKPKSRIPEPLWELAVKAVAAHGLHRTARALKLDYYSLKERVEAVPGPRAETRANGSAFLELPPALASAKECLIEFEDKKGRLRVHLKGYDAGDIATVGRRLRGVE